MSARAGLLVVAVASALACGAASAADANTTIGLREAALIALHHDPRMTAAAAGIEAAQAGIDVAQAQDGLTLGIAADYGYADLETRAPFPESGRRWPNTVGAQASQPLWSGGRSAAQERAARRNVVAALEHRRDTGGRIILAALTAYLDARRDRETLTLAEQSRAAIAKAADDTAKRLAAGEATRTDLAQAQARLAEAEATVERARAQRAATEITLARLLGPDVAPERLAADWPTVPALPGARDEAVRQALDAPAVRSAQANAEAAAAQIDVAQAERMPKLSLDARAGTQDNSDFGYRRIDTWAVQAKLNLPILTGGLVQARSAEARARARVAAANADDTGALFAETAAREWELLKASETVIAASRSQLAASDLALDGVRKELAVGTRTTLDLLNAERERLQAEVSLVGAQRDRAVVAFSLLAACGRLELENVPE